MKNTAVQEVINELISKAKAEQYKTTTYWIYIECINILESKLEKEKQDLIDAFGYGFDTGINYENQVQGEFSNDIDYYNKTFKQ